MAENASTPQDSSDASKKRPPLTESQILARKQARLRYEARKKAMLLGLDGPPLLRHPNMKTESERETRRLLVERARKAAETATEKEERLARARKYAADRLATNREEINTRQRRAYNKDIETSRKRVREIARERRRSDPAAERARDRCRYEKNKDKIQATRRRHRLANLDAHRAKEKECSRRWWSVNKELMRERRRSDPTILLIERLRSRVHAALAAVGRKKRTRSVALVGCMPKELRAHLEAQFLAGMSWDNYGLWHVDHIRPVCTFDLTDIEQQKIAFHYTNLRPLWAADNLARRRRTWTAGAA